MTRRHVVTLIGLGVASCLLGYLLAFVIFGDALASVFSSGGSAARGRDWIAELMLQLTCGVPLPVVVGASVALAPVLLTRFVRIPPRTWYPIVPALGFVGGFVLYFPWNLFLIVGSAF